MAQSTESRIHTHTPTHIQTHTHTQLDIQFGGHRVRSLAAPLANVRLRVHKLSNSIAFRTVLLLLPSSLICFSYSSLLLLLLPMGLAWQCSLSPASASPCERDRERAWRNHTPRLIYCALSNYP